MPSGNFGRPCDLMCSDSLAGQKHERHRGEFHAIKGVKAELMSVCWTEGPAFSLSFPEFAAGIGSLREPSLRFSLGVNLHDTINSPSLPARRVCIRPYCVPRHSGAQIDSDGKLLEQSMASIGSELLSSCCCAGRSVLSRRFLLSRRFHVLSEDEHGNDLEMGDFSPLDLRKDSRCVVIVTLATFQVFIVCRECLFARGVQVFLLCVEAIAPPTGCLGRSRQRLAFVCRVFPG